MHLPVTNNAVGSQRWNIGPLYSFFKNCTCTPVRGWQCGPCVKCLNVFQVLCTCHAPVHTYKPPFGQSLQGSADSTVRHIQSTVLYLSCTPAHLTTAMWCLLLQRSAMIIVRHSQSFTGLTAFVDIFAW
jgi:hypothetical protein